MITRREILRRLALGGLVSPLLLRRVGAAYSFNGSNRYLWCNSTVASGVPLTMSCWFRKTGNTTNGVLLGVFDKDTSTNGLYIAAEGATAGDPITAVSVATSPFYVAATTSGFTVGEWTHALGVFAATNSRTVYINNGSAGSNTNNSVPVGVDSVALGVLLRPSPMGYFDGELAEPAIWSVANLTAEERAALARGVSPMKVRPQSLIFYPPLIRELIDVRTGVTLTAVNSPTVAAHPRIYR